MSTLEEMNLLNKLLNKLRELPEGLKDHELVCLIKDVLENPEKYKEEAKLILLEEVFTVDSSVVSLRRTYEVILGDVLEVTLETFREEVPVTQGMKIAIIPKTKPVVIKFEEHTCKEPAIHRLKEYFYIFTGSRWIRVDINP